VIEGTASHTARSVAAHRLQYERAAAQYGDPVADEALTRDVADGLTPEPGRMHEYIRRRTAFFDRVVVNSLDRGITQVVIGGAGYDGRAFRYARPGVRWFEVDHPATQQDKRARITRLGLTTPPLAFIPADFTVDPVAEPLLAAGLNPAVPALFLFEGVAVYLEHPVIERVLAEFRAVTPVGSPLAISVSTGADARIRARFAERVAALGEPARTVLTLEDASALLAVAGWKLRQPDDRQRPSGLLLAHATTATDEPETKTDHPERPHALPGRPTPRLGSPAEPPAALPLSALLSQALVAFTVEADNETEHRLPHRTSNRGRAPGSPPGAPWLTSLLMYENCLRHLPDTGITIAELHARARTGTNLDGMRRWRYVRYSPDPAPGKPPRPDTLIRPTVWGIEARDTWRAVLPEIESRWRDRLGAQEFSALRAALAGLAARLDPSLPDCLPILGYGLRAKWDPEDLNLGPQGPEDPSLGPRSPGTPNPGVGASSRPPSSPAAAGSLADAAGVADLPLWALLARPLVAFAAQYEAEPGPSLALSANVLRVLTADGVYTKDLPALGGVSKEAVAMAMGVLRKSGLVTEGPDPAGGRYKHTRLTSQGVAARDEYPALAADIERDWRNRYGDATVTALRQALEPLAAGDPPRLYAGLAPYPDNWRAQLPQPATLPHFPMTLHRGGYPDGS
jgi:methyltransferase (TIGR00027 family)